MTTPPNNNFKFPRIEEETKLMDISSAYPIDQDISRDAIRKLKQETHNLGLSSAGAAWKSNHSIGSGERVHHAGMYEIDADAYKHAGQIDNRTVNIAQFAPYQAMCILDLIPKAENWYAPENIGLNLIEDVKKAGKNMHDPVVVEENAVKQLARIKDIDNYENLPDSPRDWAYHATPKGFITIFMNLETLAIINFHSISEGLDANGVFRSMMDNSAVYGIPIEKQFVGWHTPAPAYGTHQIIPFVGHEDSGRTYYADAGWHILCAMNRLGFDVNRFKAVVNLRHKQQKKQGLYMTFKIPTFPSLEGLATPSSDMAMVKGDAVKIFQAALTAAR